MVDEEFKPFRTTHHPLRLRQGDIYVQHDTRLKVYGALCVMMVCWGLSFVATKIALESFPTFTLIFLRFGLGSCLFLVIMARYGFPRFSRKGHVKVFFTSLFEPGLYFVFETIGLQHTTAPKASLIIAMVPIAVTIFAFIFLKERTRLAGIIGILISVIGITILITGAADFRWTMKGNLLGDLFIFGAVISAALYTIAARDVGQTYSAFEITGMQTLYGTLFYFPAFLWELPDIQWCTIHFNSVGALVFQVLFATVGAFLAYNYALTKVPASRAAVFINGIPVVTAIGAWILLGETLTPIQAAGGVLVLFGVFLANVRNGKSPSSSL